MNKRPPALECKILFFVLLILTSTVSAKTAIVELCIWENDSSSTFLHSTSPCTSVAVVAISFDAGSYSWAAEKLHQTYIGGLPAIISPHRLSGFKISFFDRSEQTSLAISSSSLYNNSISGTYIIETPISNISIHGRVFITQTAPSPDFKVRDSHICLIGQQAVFRINGQEINSKELSALFFDAFFITFVIVLFIIALVHKAQGKE